MSYTLIDASELLAELATIYSCEFCQAGVGIHVEHEGRGDHEYGGDWHVVVMHTEGCRPGPRPRTLRLIETATGPRCRSCGALLMADIGAGDEGEPEVFQACPRCEPRPSTYGGVA